MLSNRLQAPFPTSCFSTGSAASSPPNGGVRGPADTRLLPGGKPLQRCLQEFHKPLDGQFPVGELAAGGLRYDMKDAVLIDTAAKTAGYEFLVLWRKAGRIRHVKPQRHTAGHLVDILSNLTRP